MTEPNKNSLKINDITDENGPDTIPTSTDPRIGTLLSERYLILSSLGEGGMGCVYQAKHTLMDKPVAIKLIHAELAHVKDVVKRFEREALSSSRLSDPHCIAVTDFGRADDGTLFLVMELLDGEALDHRLDRDSHLSVRESVRITSEILQGLDHAHEVGVVHRDLKPENIQLITYGEEKDFVKILDFGIAKIASGTGANEKLTKSGIVFGTPKYLSPEAALGDEVDHRADLYAVGIMMFEMLTGHPPYAAPTAMDTMSMHLTGKIPDLADYGDFPVGLQPILEKALAKTPTERYASAADYLRDMEALDLTDIRKRNTQVVNLDVGDKTKDLEPQPSTKKSGGKIIVFAALVAILLAAGGYFLWQQRSNGSNVDQAPSKKKHEDVVSAMTDLGIDADRIKKILSKGDEQLKMGKVEEAIATINTAFDINADIPAAKLLLGHAKFVNLKRDEAMLLYEGALVSNSKLKKDARFQKNIRIALEWKESREMAASLIATYSGEDGVKLLAGLCNSAFTEGAVRRTSREALVKSGNDKAINWLESLTADFKETDRCLKRKKTIAQMEAVGDKGFVKLLMPLAEKKTKKVLRTIKDPRCKKGRKCKWKPKKRYEELIVYKNACLGHIAEKAIKNIQKMQSPSSSDESAAGETMAEVPVHDPVGKSGSDNEAKEGAL